MNLYLTVSKTNAMKLMKLFRSAKKGTYLVDSSTIDPTIAQTVAKEARKSGLNFIDGPVSGGINNCSLHNNFIQSI